MLNHQRRAVRSVMDMSLFPMLLLSGLLYGASGLWREYHYINATMSWSEAQSYCRERFTDLATVDSMDDVNRTMNTVNDGYNGSVWIGLKRTTQSRWGWSNGENTISQYNRWWKGEPNGIHKSEFCVLSYCRFWSDIECNQTFPFICYDEGIGYIKKELLKNWTDAQSYCRQYHTDLATIRSTKENVKAVNTLFGCGTQVWIGLYLDFWQWSDQWSLFFRNWDVGYTSQSSGSGDCVAMSTTDSGKWIQVPCTEQRPFICYGGVKKQIVKITFACDRKHNLNDPSMQAGILNQITEKLKSAGVDSHDAVNWRKDEDGEVFHPENHTVQSIIKCDQN